MPTRSKAQHWLDNRQAAARIGVRPETLANWRHKGIGPRYEKLGDTPKARVRYSAHVVDAWVRLQSGAAR